jgi:hypothetical protein
VEVGQHLGQGAWSGGEKVSAVAKVGEGQQDCQPAPHNAPTPASSARSQDAAIHTRRRRCRTHARSTGCALCTFDEKRREHGAEMRGPSHHAATVWRKRPRAHRCMQVPAPGPLIHTAPSPLARLLAASMTARGGPCAGAARPVRRRSGWRAWPCVPVRLGRGGEKERAARGATAQTRPQPHAAARSRMHLPRPTFLCAAPWL